jgi:hypothetical protein
MKYAKKKYRGAIKKNKKNITSSQPRKLIFGIQPYLTQLDEIRKNNTNWVPSKKIGLPSKKNKIYIYITSSQPRKVIFGIQPYLTQLDEIRKNNTDWGAIKKINKIGVPYKLFLVSIKIKKYLT